MTRESEEVKAVNANNGKGKKSKVYLDTNLQIIFAVTLMTVLGVSNISSAFPEIERELEISKQAVGLLIVVFTIPGIVFTPVLGVLADRFGRKRILVPSLLLFGIAGGICSLVHDFDLLLILRFLQGIGVASLGSINVTIIGDLYSGERLATAMGYNASVRNISVPSYLIIKWCTGILSMVLSLCAIRNCSPYWNPCFDFSEEPGTKKPPGLQAIFEQCL